MDLSPLQLDMPEVLAALGVEPGHVLTDSINLTFVQDVPVITYTIRRPVPGPVLAAALMRGVGNEQPDVEPVRDTGTGDTDGDVHTQTYAEKEKEGDQPD